MDEQLQEMIAPAPSRSDLARRRRLMSTFAIVALAVVGITSLTTSALFTDNESITGGAITTGTVNLTTSGALTFDVPPIAGLAPGDAAFAEVKVTNSGSLAYRYAVTYLATDGDTSPGTVSPPPGVTGPAHLSSQLKLTAFVLGTGGTCDHAGTDAAISTVTWLASVGPLKTDALAPFIGDLATRDQGSNRTLAATTSENLCFRVDLPIGTSNAYQDTSTTITLRFDAEQTTNNP